MSYSRAIIASLLLALATPAQATFWSPHIGADYKYWDLNPEAGYKALFPEIKHGYNVYVGTRINGFFGVDFGYEQSLEGRKSHTFNGEEIIFFDPIQVALEDLPNPAPAGSMTAVEMRMHDVHLDLNFYWEVYKRFEVLFMIGAAYLHPNTHIYYFDTVNWVEFRNKSRAKWSGRFGIGVQYNPIPQLGIKALLYGDQSSRIEYVGFTPDNVFYVLHPYTKSVAVNLGVVYSFSNPRRHVYKSEEDEFFY